MIDREQVPLLHRQNHALAKECARLRLRLCDMHRECRELAGANAELRVELAAGDVVIGEAMDNLLGGGEGALA
jgi:hypothetical protein